jgi:uncharacterized protein
LDKTLRLTTEVFSLPYKGKYIVYAPLKNIVFLTNGSTVNLLSSIKEGKAIPEKRPAEKKVIEFLKKEGLAGYRADKKTLHPQSNKFFPTRVTLFPTSDCSLRCVYCYANGGDSPKNMDVNIAKAAIDMVAANAKKKKEKEFRVGFHGGGDPAAAWQVFKASVLYARKVAKRDHLKVRIDTASNAILNNSQIEWIARYLNGINISFDGPKDVQDQQRPFPNGKGSFDKVVSCIKKFEQLKFKYGLRATITDTSVRRMKEAVNFIHSHFSIKGIHIEPLFSCGRCQTSGVSSPSPRVFIKEFKRASKAAARYGMRLYYSGAVIDSFQSVFCGASGYNFCVTPDGYVTSCFEVSSPEDPRSDIFFYGSYDRKTSRFTFDRKKLGFLRSKTVDRMPYCTDCFCKWSCAGDCIAKHPMEKTGRSEGRWRCDINRELSKWELVKRLEKADKSGKPGLTRE